MTDEAIWDAIRTEPPQRLDALFAGDAGRLDALSGSVAGLYVDLSKTHLTPALIGHFGELGEATGFAAARDALYSGAVVNPTENRAATHVAERGEGKPDDVAAARALHARMRALIDAVEADALGPVSHILHIGIGGSALGPDLLVDALGREGSRYDVAVVSNVDGASLDVAIKRFDPHSTLLVLASKTFTTSETLLNASSAIAWMTEHGVDDPYGRTIALTAAPEKAVEWGVDETRVLPFADSVGGRYSLWSSIGFPAALALGWQAFEELLEGAAEVDRHFRFAETTENLPLLAAFSDLYYTRIRGAETRGVFAYDERLRLLPPYLQQLEMESNGKRVTVDGEPIDGATAPITWGGVGTDAQHAVFQLLHQGTHVVPLEFVAAIEPEHTLDPAHHRALLGNCFAQGAALMAGKTADDPARSYPGDRPSMTILMDSIEPRTLGALLAFHEARTFANAALMRINPFDQFGVELGKEMAKALEAGGGDFDPSTKALIERAGL